MQSLNLPFKATFYAEVPGYSRRVYARFGDAFDIQYFSRAGIVLVVIQKGMNATAAVEYAIKWADSIDAERSKAPSEGQ